MKWWLLQLLGAIHSCWVPRTKAAVSVAGGRPWIAAMASRPESNAKEWDEYDRAIMWHSGLVSVYRKT